MWLLEIAFLKVNMWFVLWPSLYFCWAVLVTPTGFQVIELGWIHVGHWLTGGQSWDWAQTVEIWSPAPLPVPSYHLGANGKTSLETASWTWLQKRKALFSHHLSPNLYDVKILHFTWPFLYNFSNNLKTAFTEGCFWIEHNFHFIESN